MSSSLLITILFCALASGIIALFVLIPKKRGDERYDKITAIATFMTAVATIIVGISTVSVTKHEEERDKLQNQPLYLVKIDQQYSSEKSLFDNEEYSISNIGKKTKSKTDVQVYSFIEISYTDVKNHASPIIKLLPLSNYFGASFYTNNLDGLIKYSLYSGNNLERYVSFYNDALRYHESHSEIYVLVRKYHYFVLEYVDLFGEKHKIVKTEENEVEPKQFEAMLKRANSDAPGINLDLNSLDIDSIVETLFVL